MCVLLAAAVTLVFGPVVRFGFVNFGDHAWRTALQGAGASLGWILSADGGWHPLAKASHLLDEQLFGDWAGGHHVLNLLLHVAATVMLFLVLRGGTGRLWRSAFVAGVFALHPLAAETTSWISARGEALSTFFFMATLLVYARAAEAGNARHVWVVPPLVAGLLSGRTAIAAPFVLLMFDYWPLQRMHGAGLRDVLKAAVPKIPLFALSAAAFAVAVLCEAESGTSLAVRLESAGASLGAGLWRMVYPLALACVYPIPIEAGLWWTWLWPLLLILTVTIVVWLLRRKRPYLLVGWLWYLAVMAPAFGLWIAGRSPGAVADSDVSLASVGPWMAVTWLLASVWLRGKFPNVALAILAAIILIPLAWTARLQSLTWADSESLWRHAATAVRGNTVAYRHLGFLFLEGGRPADAVVAFDLAAKADRRDADTLAGLGRALLETGNIERAVEVLRAAHEARPGDLETAFHLGNALLHARLADAAILLYEQVLAAQPNHAQAHNNLATVLLQRGRRTEAIAHFRQAVNAGPQGVQARNNLASALMQDGQLEEARRELEAALEVDPDFGMTHANLADLFMRDGRAADAARHLGRAVELDRAGTDAGIRNGLAWMLATSRDDSVRDGKRALEVAEEANRLAAGKSPAILLTLSAAQAEAGDPASALETARAALKLAVKQDNEEVANTIRQAIPIYESGQSLRVGPATDNEGR